MSQSNVEIFKSIMGSYPTGVTIVTSADDELGLAGLTVNSFASVSLEPTLVLFCVDKRASSLPVFQKAKKFAVHVLADDQEELCFRFASKDSDRYGLSKWEMSARNLPILEGVCGLFECKTVQEVDAGDHIIFIGEVEHAQKFDKEPMLYFRRKVGPIPVDWADPVK